MTLVLGLCVLGLRLLDDRYGIQAGEMPENLWPEGSYRTPDSYWLRGVSGGMPVEQMALMPDRFRIEGDGRIGLVDGMYFWDISFSEKTYYGLPVQAQIEAGNIPSIPTLHSGREVISDIQGLPITRFSQSAVGPTTPERLMGYIGTAVSLGGTWRLTEGEFLGRPMHILNVKVTRVRPDAGMHIGPYEETLWIDKEFLFVLAWEGPGFVDGRNEVTEIQFNIPLDETRFVLNPPDGYRHCYPASYTNRGEGCR